MYIIFPEQVCRYIIHITRTGEVSRV